MSDVKLTPCPFCGCTTITHEDDGYIEWLKCDWCDATGPYSSDDADAKRTIEQAWDNRFAKQLTPCPHDIEDAGDDYRISAGSRAEWAKRALIAEAQIKCPIGLDDNPAICSAGRCLNCLSQRALIAEAERDRLMGALREIAGNYCIVCTATAYNALQAMKKEPGDE